MIRNNLCPSTIRFEKPDAAVLLEFLEVALDEGVRVWVNQRVQGVVPILLVNLLAERKRVKCLMKAANRETVEGMAVYNILNAKQMALKVSANSIYGIFGANMGYFALEKLSRTVTAIGRGMLLDVCSSIKENHPDKQVVYGDSVAASTPILVQYNGEVLTMSIHDFWSFLKGCSTLAILQHHAHKEAIRFDSGSSTVVEANFHIYSDHGWTAIRNFIRHKPRSRRLFRIRTANGSVVEVTGDHSLLLVDGTCIQPSKVEIGSRLMTKFFSTPLDLKDAPKVVGEEEDVVESELHLHDRYEAQKMILHLGKRFVDVVVSGSVYKITYISKEVVGYISQDGGTVVGITRFTIPEDEYVYDFETVNHHFSAGLGTLVVHNTDSVFVKLPTVEEDAAFTMGENLAREITRQLFAPPILLEFEKVIHCFLLFKKKNYVGLMKETRDGKLEMQEKGLISVQKSTPLCVAKIYQEAIDKILSEKSPRSLYEMTRGYLEQMLRDELPRDLFVETRKLKDSYANPMTIPHSRVAEMVNQRFGSQIYRGGDRIPYVHYVPPNVSTLQLDCMKVSDKVEDPNFVFAQGYKLNYRQYIGQIKNALLELAKLFPAIYKMEEELFQTVLEDPRINDGVGKKKMKKREEEDLPLKKRRKKITAYFLPKSLNDK
jgi:hypothetical protein